jgi:3-methylcrotonyl-CoA carboxylase alpha subunit
MGITTSCPLPAQSHNSPPPPVAANIRIDTGIREGDAVTIYYDPLIAKITAWGKNRDVALKQLTKALSNTHIKGIKTNLNFLQRLLAFPDVREGAPDIGFIDRYVDGEAKGIEPPEEAYILAALWLYQASISRSTSVWMQQDGWRLNAPAVYHFHFTAGASVSLTSINAGMKVNFGEKIYQVFETSFPDENSISVKLSKGTYHAQVTVMEKEVHVYLNGRLYRLKQKAANTLEVATPGAGGHLMAPMPGRIVSVPVTLGEAVEAGQPLIILEAMKMEHTILAPYNGIVDHLPFASGDFCEEGVELVRLRGR